MIIRSNKVTFNVCTKTSSDEKSVSSIHWLFFAPFQKKQSQTLTDCTADGRLPRPLAAQSRGLDASWQRGYLDYLIRSFALHSEATFRPH